MMTRNLLILCLVVCMPVFLTAQSGHYWSNQYGTRSMLLSGSVIGGVQDLGAVYYNPARLTMVEKPTFLLSADVYELLSIRAEDAFGNNKNASESEFDGVPSLAAGTFKLGFLPGHQFAYATMMRSKSDLSFSFQDEVMGDVIPDIPGEEVFGAQARYAAKQRIQWTGVSWSYQLKSGLSIGLTGILAFENESRTNETRLNLLSAANEVGLYELNRRFQFKKYSLLSKLGASYALGEVTLGATMNLPQINVFGKGDYRYEEFVSGLNPIIGISDGYITTYQSDLHVRTKSPFSLGLGLSMPFCKGTLHLSTEWYSGIGRYRLMQSEPYRNAIYPDQEYVYTLEDKLKSVINAGIGWEMTISGHVWGYLSACTDFSAVPDETLLFNEYNQTAARSNLKMDFYHFGGGVVVKVKGADITLGVTRAGASQKFSRIIDFPDGDSGPILESDENSTLKVSRWRFIFSFSVPFLEEYAEKIGEKLEDKLQGNEKPEKEKKKKKHN